MCGQGGFDHIKSVAVCDALIVPLCTLCTFGFAFSVYVGVLLWLWREHGNQFGGSHHLFNSPLPTSTCVIDDPAVKRRT